MREMETLLQYNKPFSLIYKKSWKSLEHKEILFLIIHQSNSVNLNNHRRPSDDWPYELRYTVT